MPSYYIKELEMRLGPDAHLDGGGITVGRGGFGGGGDGGCLIGGKLGGCWGGIPLGNRRGVGIMVEHLLLDHLAVGDFIGCDVGIVGECRRISVGGGGYGVFGGPLQIPISRGPVVGFEAVEKMLQVWLGRYHLRHALQSLYTKKLVFFLKFKQDEWQYFLQ